jgi:hypothetical protein
MLKHSHYLRCYLSLLIFTLILTACSKHNTPSSRAPTAGNVSITDDNGGDTVVGDNLTGHYTYSDVNGDPEGITSFRWLRNGTAISAATASTYSLTAADSGQTISFPVCRCARYRIDPSMAQFHSAQRQLLCLGRPRRLAHASALK